MFPSSCRVPPCAMPPAHTVAQPPIVATTPGIELALGRDGGAIGAATGDVHHVLARLLAREGRDHLGLLQRPVETEGTNGVPSQRFPQHSPWGAQAESFSDPAQCEAGVQHQAWERVGSCRKTHSSCQQHRSHGQATAYPLGRHAWNPGHIRDAPDGQGRPRLGERGDCGRAQRDHFQLLNRDTWSQSGSKTITGLDGDRTTTKPTPQTAHQATPSSLSTDPELTQNPTGNTGLPPSLCPSLPPSSRMQP